MLFIYYKFQDISQSSPAEYCSQEHMRRFLFFNVCQQKLESIISFGISVRLYALECWGAHEKGIEWIGVSCCCVVGASWASPQSLKCVHTCPVGTYLNCLNNQKSTRAKLFNQSKLQMRKGLQNKQTPFVLYILFLFTKSITET